MFWSRKNSIDLGSMVTPFNINFKSSSMFIRKMIANELAQLSEYTSDISAGDVCVQVPVFEYGTGITHIRILYALDNMRTSDFEYFKENILLKRTEVWVRQGDASVCQIDPISPVAWGKWLNWNLKVLKSTEHLNQYCWNLETEEPRLKGIFSEKKCVLNLNHTNPNYGSFNLEKRDTLILEKEHSEEVVGEIKLTDGKETISEDGKHFTARRVTIDDEIKSLIETNLLVADFACRYELPLSFDNDG